MILTSDFFSPSSIIPDEDSIQLIDEFTYQTHIYERVLFVPILDEIIYRNRNGIYYVNRTIINSREPISLKLFGAKGDGKYDQADKDKLSPLTTDDKDAIGKFIASRKKTNLRGSHYGGSTLYVPFSIYKTSGSYIINDHFTTICGEGYGASMFHCISESNINDPLITFTRNMVIPNGDAYDYLLTGGGLKNFHIKTNNTNIRNFGLMLDYVEYMSFQDTHIEGFGKSAIKGGFWECNFSNIKLTSCGGLQTADILGNPEYGVIDTSGGDSLYADASNNTLFSKLTFSSCVGTLLKFTNNKNSTVNMNIVGLYAETYPGDSSNIDELPLIYALNSRGNSITGGFITVNTTNVFRNGTVIKMDSSSDLSLNNLTITMNPIDGYLKRSVRRLRSFASLSTETSVLSLNNVKLSDPTDSIGYRNNDYPYSTPPLIEGTGYLTFTKLLIEILSLNAGGTSNGSRRITNLIDRRLKANGDLILMPFDTNGMQSQLKKKVNFLNGKIDLYTDSVPTTIDTWEQGDRIIYQNNSAGGYMGKVCVKSGTTGSITGITGSIQANSNLLIVNDSSQFLNGDWISIAGSDFNRIIEINGNHLTLKYSEPQSLNTANITFYEPIWKNFANIEN
ncbi:hypothetical protein [Chryseobacterium luteum]|uniref:Pectate lyase superfamily protein domain-containing protein n=1 Tax=Chryseobacterium luteum TaxID=421531 RepID=A0A085ZAQ5_9FLAO|nr:hypothetical protein [Chryseobacterium luteum]KFF01519.1 hypothetical protein IX38_17670 [Chryseobacterium luteum]